MAFELDPETEALFGGPVPPVSEQSPAPNGFRVPTGAGSELAIAGDAYEGASRISQALAAYNPAIRTPDQDISSAKNISDARSRDLARNDATLMGGIRLRQDGIVGSYFMLNARPNSLMLFGKEDTVWEDEFSEEIEERFAAYAESGRHWIDAGRRHTLTGLTRMAIEQHTVYGEVFASVEWIRGGLRSYSTAIQMIDTDRLSTPFDKLDKKKVSMGVQMGYWDEPIGYYVRMAHPSDWERAQELTQWKYNPAELKWGRQQMIHIFDQHRAGQSRGIGTMVSAIPDMKLNRQFREIVLQNAILNATYAATVESELDSASIFARLGGTDFRPEEVQEALTNYMIGHYGALSATIGKSNQLKMGGLKIPHLPPGTKLNLQGAGQGGPLGTEFERSLERKMAAAFGVSYEQFSRDYSKTNYSSGKMASVETYKAMLSIKKAVADLFASTVYRLWFEEALNQGVFTTLRRRMPSFYEGDNAEFYTACDWIGASRGQVDELKETQAAVLRINNGISTLEDENARLGKDWRKQLRQMKREQEWKDYYGILQNPTDTTNQENAASGTKKEVSAKAPSSGTAANLFLDSEHEHEDEKEVVSE